MIPLIQREIVEKRSWVDETEFFELLALAQSSPGPIAVNTSVFVGYKVGGIGGSLVATLGAVLPSFLIILVIVAYLASFRSIPQVEAVFKGLRPAVVALIAAPLYSLGKTMQIGASGAIVAVAVALMVACLGFSPAIVVVGAAVVGLAVGVFRRRQLRS